MDVERETLVEIVVAVVAVAMFIAILLTMGVMFSGSSFSGTGGLALVGSIAFFVLVMTAAGFWLANSLN